VTRQLLTPECETQVGLICRATVIAICDSGNVVVAPVTEDQEVTCERLVTSDTHELRLAPHDSVLVWSASNNGHGVILGRIAVGPAPVNATESEHLPDELVIEANHTLTLKCGSGSITIREDGKILIKGKDLVSHAQRLNRIKGGAVQIN